MLFDLTHNAIKDPQWYVVQVIRRGGNDDAHCVLARTIIFIGTPAGRFL